MFHNIVHVFNVLLLHCRNGSEKKLAVIQLIKPYQCHTDGVATDSDSDSDDDDSADDEDDSADEETGELLSESAVEQSSADASKLTSTTTLFLNMYVF